MTHRIEFPQSRCLLGVCHGDITPEVGTYHRMWGAARHDQSTGIHDNLYQTTLVMAPVNCDNPVSDCVVMIGIDHCLFGAKELGRILDRIASAAKLSKGQIVILFSHTHGAGLLADDRVDLPGGDRIPPYFDFLAKSLSDSVCEAIESLQPATWVWGAGHCSLATNRDYFDSDSRPVCGFNPDRTTDTTVIAGRASADSSGEPLATLINYACHPTTLAWDNTLISPDYVGSMRRLVEEQYVDAPCLFIQGASGDVGPRHGFVGDTAVADQNGRQLGYAAMSVLESLPPAATAFEYRGPVVSGATIGIWDFTPLTPERRDAIGIWIEHHSACSLPHRRDLPQKGELLSEQRSWQEALQKAEELQDTAQVAEARAMLERIKRRLFLIGDLPEGSDFLYSLRIWKMGDAIWLALNGELYNVLQTRLRDRFPDLVLIVGTLANGSTVWYLPDETSYGKGLYQEQASVLAQGSLETLIDSLTSAIESLVT